MQGEAAKGFVELEEVFVSLEEAEAGEQPTIKLRSKERTLTLRASACAPAPSVCNGGHRSSLSLLCWLGYSSACYKKVGDSLCFGTGPDSQRAVEWRVKPSTPRLPGQ